MRIAILCLLLIGCSNRSQVEITLSGEKAEQLLKFYIGSYIQEDPFSTGVLQKQNDRFYLDLSSLEESAPDLVADLEFKRTGNTLVPESLYTVVQSSYYQARDLPKDLAEFHTRWPTETPQIFEVHGPVTHYLRRIIIEESTLHRTILEYYQNGEELIYDIGTVIRAEHISEGRVVETTAMIKRFDGFWDFITYDSTGALGSKTLPNPRELATPTKCAGCHFGKKVFEPEGSWPLDAPQAPEGIRRWYSRSRDQQVADFFMEHVKRSDLLLGLYATTYVSDLRLERNEGTIDSSSTALLNYLGL